MSGFLQIELALCSHYKVLPTEERYKQLSFYQKIILYKGLIESRNEQNVLITDILDALKPWLDKDLWYELKHKTENTHINAEWSSKNLDDMCIVE